MKAGIRILALVVSLTLCLPSVGRGQSTSRGPLGKVDFPNSCSLAVQETFQRGVAMLHSFWFIEGEKTFREVGQDPSCAIVTWGIAAVLMVNPLAGRGPFTALRRPPPGAVTPPRRSPELGQARGFLAGNR